LPCGARGKSVPGERPGQRFHAPQAGRGGARHPGACAGGEAVKVQVKNLRKEFGKTVAVDNISFAFDSGHIFGFVGPNGAGKTTTMRIIATIEEPTDGDVLLNGISLREQPELARRAVGYVPDTLPAHADVTV